MERYLGKTEFAKRIGVSRDTLNRMKLPPADAMIGRTRGWFPKTVDDWTGRRPGRGKTAPHNANWHLPPEVQATLSPPAPPQAGPANTDAAPVRDHVRALRAHWKPDQIAAQAGVGKATVERMLYTDQPHVRTVTADKLLAVQIPA